MRLDTIFARKDFIVTNSRLHHELQSFHGTCSLRSRQHPIDRLHSLRCAISSVQEKFAVLRQWESEELVTRYDSALQRAYDKYLSKETTYGETVSVKIRLFFTELGLPDPSFEEAKDFCAVHRQAYRRNRKATPGSIETLVRLREYGHRLAIVTNGQVRVQEEKAKAIGVSHLVDRIFTSEELGCPNPDPRIFEFAVNELGASENVPMVGDNINTDIKGGLSAILYSPTAQQSPVCLFGNEVPFSNDMHQVLQHLGIAEP